MNTETNIEDKVYDINLFDLMEGTEVKCSVETYSENGTLAVPIMCRPELPDDIPEVMMGKIPFNELYGVATVNLPQSDELPLNVQYVDENNLPGIGEWLEKNGIATPTERMTRSGWCLYQAYEFNVPEHKLEEILTRRMEINPVQTRTALASVERDRIYDLMDDLDRCVTLGELKESWESMPKGIREDVDFPDRISAEGHEHTIKQWENKHRFSEAIPDGLEVYTLSDARRIFEKAKAEILKGDYPTRTRETKDGTETELGQVSYTQTRSMGIPMEYSNDYIVELRNPEGRLTREFVASRNSYSDDLCNGPSLKYLPGGQTAFAIYSADRFSDNQFREAEYTFSRKGSLISISPGDTGPEFGTIRQSSGYEAAVEKCRNSLKEGLEKVISRIENQNMNKSKGMKV